MADNTLNDAIKKSMESESVDDILSQILNADGTFNNQYNGLFARYLGIDMPSGASVSGDLSDRSGEGYTAEYTNPDYPGVVSRGIEQSIESKMGGNQAAYRNQMASETHPSFTSGGDVKYPSIGSGETEQRVVYDADWENRAKQEAERARRYSQNNPYGGRQQPAFVAGGQELSRMSYKPVIEQPTSPFVDPISEDDDFDRYWARQYEQNQKKSFFQEGLREKRVKDETATATDRNPSGSRSRVPQPSGNTDWLQVDGSGKNRHRNRKKDRSAIPDRGPLPKQEDTDSLTSSDIIGEKNRAARRTYISRAEQDAKKAEQTAEELRNTVAEIVDKYDKKTREEQLARAKAEKERLESEKKAAEEAALANAVKQKQRIGISETLCNALDEEDENGPGVYDDFSDNAESGFENI